MSVNLYVDLETLQLIQGTGQRNAFASLRFKRGDAAILRVVFLENAITPVTIGNPTGLEIQIGIKPRNQFDHSYLAQSTDWIMPVAGDETPTYVCTLSLNTIQLNAALNIGSATAEELPEITLMGEITFREGTGEPTSTRTFIVVVENDVNRGTEGIPNDATPSFPFATVAQGTLADSSLQPEAVDYRDEYNNGDATYGIGSVVLFESLLYVKISNPLNAGYPPGGDDWELFEPSIGSPAYDLWVETSKSSLNWQDRTLRDTDNDVAVQWQARTLHDYDGTVVANWNTSWDDGDTYGIGFGNDGNGGFYFLLNSAGMNSPGGCRYDGASLVWNNEPVIDIAQRGLITLNSDNEYQTAAAWYYDANTAESYFDAPSGYKSNTGPAQFPAGLYANSSTDDSTTVQIENSGESDETEAMALSVQATGQGGTGLSCSSTTGHGAVISGGSAGAFITGGQTGAYIIGNGTLHCQFGFQTQNNLLQISATNGDIMWQRANYRANLTAPVTQPANRVYSLPSFSASTLTATATLALRDQPQTFSNLQTFGGGVTVSGVTQVAGLTETMMFHPGSTANKTIDISTATIIYATLFASVLNTFTMPSVSATGRRFTLFVKQNSGGIGTAVFTGVKWPGGVAPTITATAGRMDVLTFVSDGGSWYGTIAQNYI